MENKLSERLNELEKVFLLVVQENKKSARKLCRTIKKSNGQLKKALVKDS